MDQATHDAMMADKITEAERLRQERDFLFVVMTTNKTSLVRGLVGQALYGGDIPSCELFSERDLLACQGVIDAAPSHLRRAMSEAMSALYVAAAVAGRRSEEFVSASSIIPG